MMKKSFLLLILLPLAGCQPSVRTQQPRSSDYETIANAPRRNSPLAERENARGLEFLEKRDYEAAEKALKAALSADITYGPGHNNLGKLYFLQGKFYLAAWEFQYAIQLMPGRPEPKNNLGLVFEAVGKFQDAAGEYSKAMEVEPDNPQFVANLARSRVRLGEHNDEVRKLLEKVVLHDTRPEWVAWAREKLALMKKEVEPKE